LFRTNQAKQEALEYALLMLKLKKEKITRKLIKFLNSMRILIKVFTLSSLTIITIILQRDIVMEK